jgi:hypothetical protein
MKKFIKWIEVKASTSSTMAKAVEFIEEIMYMFGVPNIIITNNRTVYCEGVQGLLFRLGHQDQLCLSVIPIE